MVKKALPALPKQNVIVEPQARNTAPAIALATAHVAHVDPEGIVIVIPSDQHVADIPAFQASLEEAVAVGDVDARQEAAVVCLPGQTVGLTSFRPAGECC
jgi:mannose-1-phosphate guanylyltransferase